MRVSRTQRSKILYLLALGALSAIAFAVLAATNWSWWAIVAIAVLLFVPGRIQGHFFRSFFRGRRLQANGDFQDAIDEYEQFIEEIERHPWIGRLLWLTWSIYTFDMKAMTRNNIGACQLELGQLHQAEENFYQAARLDAQSPLPHYNLAVLAEVRGQREAAEREYSIAKSLGYNRDSFDLAIHSASSILARLEGGSSGRRED